MFSLPAIQFRSLPCTGRWWRWSSCSPPQTTASCTSVRPPSSLRSDLRTWTKWTMEMYFEQKWTCVPHLIPLGSTPYSTESISDASALSRHSLAKITGRRRRTMPSELFMRLIFCRDTAQALMLSTQGMLFDLSSTWKLSRPFLRSYLHWELLWSDQGTAVRYYSHIL